MIDLSGHSALDATVRLVACGVAVSALEMIAIRGQSRLGGAFSLAVVAPFRPQSAALLRGVDALVPLLLGVQVVAAASLVLLGPFHPAGRFALVLALAAMIVVRWRRHMAGDGAEQMAALVLIAASFAVVPHPSEQRLLAAILFVTAQVILSYETAGFAKLVSPLWRDGSALPAILSTEGHGHPWAARFFSHHHFLAMLAGRGLILFECAFVVMLFGPIWLVLATLALGALFHVICAVLMGLNSFVWSFVATYPCVMFGAIQIRSWFFT